MFTELINNLMSYNIDIFYFINFNIQNTAFDFIMPLISEIGGLLIWSLLVTLMLLFGNIKTKKLAIFIILTFFIIQLIVFIIKPIFGEPRPFETLPDVHLLGIEHDFSFPSAHSALCFGLATLIGLSCKIKTNLFNKDKNRNIYKDITENESEKPREFSTLYIFLVFAVIVAFSRGYMGAHYLFDVLAGAILGILIGFIMSKLYKKYSNNGFLNKIVNFFLYYNK